MESLFDTTVKKIRDVRVFLGFRDPKIAQIQIAHHIGENIGERLGRDDDWQSKFLVILCHADIMQILRHAFTRNCGVKVICSRQVTTSLRSESAVAGECACNLAHPVGAEVEADAGVIVTDGRYWFAAIVRTNERHDELVGYVPVIEILLALHGVNVRPTFSLAVHHRVKRLRNALPAAVAIHGVVAPAHGGNLASVVFTHFLLELFEVSGAIGRQGVTPVHEGVNEDARDAILLSHCQQRVQMSLVRVNASVREQTKEVQTASAAARILHGYEQPWAAKEFAVLDHQLDPRAVHMDDASSADVEMADLAISHLAIGKSYIVAASVDQRI